MKKNSIKQPKRAIELYEYYSNQKLNDDLDSAYNEILEQIGFKHKKEVLPEHPKPLTPEFAYCTQKEYEEFLSVTDDLIDKIYDGVINRRNYKFRLQPLENKHYYDTLIDWVERRI